VIDQSAEVEGRRDAVGLLDEIAERSLDDDYYLVRPARYSRSVQFTSYPTAVMIAIFALMVTVTAVQTQRDRPATALERKALESDVRAGQAKLATKQKLVDTLRADVDLLESVADARSPANARLHVVAGDSGVRGPGIVVRLDPKDTEIDDTSIQGVVNALWAAGAEAVSLNDQRIAALTSLGEGGGVITVNFKSVGAPFVFKAIGDPQSLRRRFSAASAAKYWTEREADHDAEFSIGTDDVLSLPAGPDHRTSVRLAQVLKEQR
jgi:uncharacterized protein YlxW (UPF0749 family)